MNNTMTIQFPSLNITSAVLATMLAIFGFALPTYAVDIVFPVSGGGNYSNDYHDARGGGRIHEATDILAEKFTEAVAVEDGVITWAPCPEPWYGYALKLDGDSGYAYWYIHLNNDNPGTDDGAAGCSGAYADGIAVGTRVSAGDVIGYVGDSGNAESTGAHLHFEMYTPDGSVMNPYDTLEAGSIIDAEAIEPTPTYDNYIEPFGDTPLGTSTTSGDVNGNGNDEIVVAAGFGGSPQIRVFTEDGTIQSQFLAFDEDFTGGVNVVTGDIDGDGKAEIIVAPKEDGGPQIKVFNENGDLLNQFMAYEEEYRGGVYLATGDIKGVGKDFIITSPAGARKPHVKIFNGNGRKIQQFKAFKKNYNTGFTVAVQDATEGDVKSSRIIVGGGIDKKPVVKVVNWRGKKINRFLAYKPKQKDGVQVFFGDVHGNDGPQRIVTAPLARSTAKLRIFTNRGKTIKKMNTFEDWDDSGFSITNVEDVLYISHTSDSKQAAIRKIEL